MKIYFIIIPALNVGRGKGSDIYVLTSLIAIIFISKYSKYENFHLSHQSPGESENSAKSETNGEKKNLIQ